MDTIVKPALSINVNSIPESMCDIIARFEASIALGQSSDIEMGNLRIACAAIRGSFDSNPLVQGIIFSAVTLVEKEGRGLTTLRGKPCNRTEGERSRIAYAAQQLALMAGNKRIARALGQSAAALKTPLDDLLANSVPCPGLALAWPEVLKQNLLLCDQRFTLHPGAPKRCLAQKFIVVYCNYLFVLSARHVLKKYGASLEIIYQRHHLVPAIMYKHVW